MKLIVIVLLIFGVVCQARHLYPGNFDPDETLFGKINNEKPEMSMGIFHNRKQFGLAPPNAEKFFQSLEPCEDGFQRDILGICREVWD